MSDKVSQLARARMIFRQTHFDQSSRRKQQHICDLSFRAQ
jgi:hypothetical protein